MRKEVEMHIRRVETPEYKQGLIEFCSTDLTMQDIEEIKEAYEPLDIAIERRGDKTCVVLKMMEVRPSESK